MSIWWCTSSSSGLSPKPRLHLSTVLLCGREADWAVFVKGEGQNNLRRPSPMTQKQRGKTGGKMLWVYVFISCGSSGLSVIWDRHSLHGMDIVCHEIAWYTLRTVLKWSICKSVSFGRLSLIVQGHGNLSSEKVGVSEEGWRTWGSEPQVGKEQFMKTERG